MISGHISLLDQSEETISDLSLYSSLINSSLNQSSVWCVIAGGQAAAIYLIKWWAAGRAEANLPYE